MSDCIFCKIAAGEMPSNKVLETENVLVFHDIAPAAKVHVLVIPKKHIASLNGHRRRRCIPHGRSALSS